MKKMAHQLSQGAATVVAQFLVLPTEDQIVVFNTLMRHQPLPLYPSPSPPPPSLVTYRTSVPFALDNTQSIWENQPPSSSSSPEAAAVVVVPEPVVAAAAAAAATTKKKKKKTKKTVIVSLEPLSDTCVQVCDMSDCVCRYTLSETDQENDTVPELVPEGIYIYLGNQHAQKGPDYWYARIAKILPFKLNQKQLYITYNRTEAYLTLNTHEDATKAYLCLLEHKFSVNWMRARRAATDASDNE